MSQKYVLSQTTPGAQEGPFKKKQDEKNGWTRKHTYASISLGTLLLIVIFLFWPESEEARFERLRQSTFRQLEIRVVKPDGTPTSIIELEEELPLRVQVSGIFEGGSSRDFQDLVVPHRLFGISLQKEEDRQVIWRSSPGELSVFDGDQFTFECPVELPKRTSEGDYALDCEYYHQPIATQTVTVQ